MSFIIRLNSVTLRALVTNPLFIIAVFPSKVLLDPNQITKCMTRVMVEATRFRAHENPLFYLRSFPF
ncbi:hypothetical protein HanIR_Chr12g0577821 [Helianthus annuus]|nr:hypothetical protein HanIR_Chr12g0577821 [Helianthus annuus]